MTPGAELAEMLNHGRYDEAMPLMEQTLREAAAESPGCLTQAARAVVAWKGFFACTSDARESERYFRRVYVTLGELAGPLSPAAMAAAENLASLLGSIDRTDEAISLREKVFEHVRSRFPIDDPRFLSVREGLAFLYRKAGDEGRAGELYRELGLCEHLQPAERFLRDSGTKLFSVCRPWSDNCHLWAFFDAVLDCERLIRELRLDPCIRIHDHRGTHDGSERGLVCGVHNDAVMGRHPLG